LILLLKVIQGYTTDRQVPVRQRFCRNDVLALDVSCLFQRLMERAQTPRSGDALPRNPTTGIAGCCARVTRGHAAAPPSVAKNFRRPMWLAM
jgi:hypothetical protein